MIYWQHLTRQANEAQSKASYVDAHELNQKALACAKATFQSDFDNDAESAVSAIIVSYLNLAEVSVCLKEWLQADNYFSQGVSFLETVINEPSLLNDDRALIDRTASHIRFEWDLFKQTYAAKLQAGQRLRHVVMNRAAIG